MVRVRVFRNTMYTLQGLEFTVRGILPSQPHARPTACPLEQYGFKHGEAIIMADTWRGPYRLVSSDSDARWGGSTANAEDPFMWIDKR